ncbi:hypothetical protein KSF_107860 [Reticulibacter mediterranei]|uniref:TIR domain-containing protein n=1 Tax=Reticulibacter mediterranei TaxID=2778369 RepID=A0A8J3IYB9_9CHLR|nr:hypothetical protein [Reticulibacter mediterranei]GHP00739.1 hypothetical protein KSF_107860 [Reticulibacter mediterranei]
MVNEEPTDVIIWNVQSDASFASEIMKHLAGMRRTEGISTKNFLLDIAAGASSAQSIARLAHARVRLILVSSDFVNALVEDQLTIDASDAVIAARDERLQNQLPYRIIPTFVRPVSTEVYEKDPLLGKIKGLPRNGRPIQAWRNQDAAWAEIASELRQVLIALGRLKPSQRSW